MGRQSDATAQAILITAPPQFNARALGLLDRQVDDAISQHFLFVDLDMVGVELLDSAALNWLLTTQDRFNASEISLRLIKVGALVADILLATRIDGRFTIQAAAADAAGE
jgi:anti-anti-sigma regulatory factor